MTKIIGGIDVDRTYSSDEVFELNTRGHLRNVTLEGYCTRVENDGTIRFVPYWESTWFRTERGKPISVDVDIATPMLEDLKVNHPIVRRSPQERVAALMLRLMTAYKTTGTLPGIPADLIRRVVGGSYREGQPLTEEVVRAVAAHYLGIGEVDNNESGSPFAIKDRVPALLPESPDRGEGSRGGPGVVGEPGDAGNADAGVPDPGDASGVAGVRATENGGALRLPSGSGAPVPNDGSGRLPGHENVLVNAAARPDEVVDQSGSAHGGELVP